MNPCGDIMSTPPWPRRWHLSTTCGLGRPDFSKLKMIALTFDDGPYPLYTPLLPGCLLKRYDVHATFFVVGQSVQQYPQLVGKFAWPVTKSPIIPTPTGASAT